MKRACLLSSQPVLRLSTSASTPRLATSSQPAVGRLRTSNPWPARRVCPPSRAAPTRVSSGTSSTRVPRAKAPCSFISSRVKTISAATTAAACRGGGPGRASSRSSTITASRKMAAARIEPCSALFTRKAIAWLPRPKATSSQFRLAAAAPTPAACSSRKLESPSTTTSSPIVSRWGTPPSRTAASRWPACSTTPQRVQKRWYVG